MQNRVTTQEHLPSHGKLTKIPNSGSLTHPIDNLLRLWQTSMEWELGNDYPVKTSYPLYEIYQFLEKLSTNELLHTEGHFNSFAYAVTTAMEHLLDSHQVNMGMTSFADIDVENTQPFLAWAPIEVIRKTLECTTQLARAHERYPMRCH